MKKPKAYAGLVVAIVCMAMLAVCPGANAALSVTPTRTIPIGTFGYGGYAPGFDGTFWTVRGGTTAPSTVGHVDDEGNDLGDGFNFSLAYPFGIAYYGGRVYMHVGGYGFQIASYRTSDGGDFLHEDAETHYRFGGNQLILRAYPDGTATVGLGQNSKGAALTLSKNIAEHPWYPMSFHGNGINDPNYDAVYGNDFETCSLDNEGVVFGEPDPHCGRYGYSDNGNLNTIHPGFNYAIDTAAGLGGMYVAERYTNRITHINTVANPGAIIDFTFGGGGGGSAAGRIQDPYSVVVQPGTHDVFVSEEGNRRISVFGAAGGYIASFGYGVLNGADEMQVCGVEIGPCQAGVPYQSDPRSYFTRLDFGPEGELLAFMPLTGQIQVFSLSGQSGNSNSGGSSQGNSGGGSGGGPVQTGPGSSGKNAKGEDVLRLAAKPIKVKKGRKTTLTAIINRGKQCANRTVDFQIKEDRSWQNLGSAVKPAKTCKATKKVKVTAKSVYRAVLIDSRNQATMGYSPKVTVKLK